MLDQPCENEYWSASCVMYGAGPYTSFRFLFSMRTTTSWSKLPVASEETGPEPNRLLGALRGTIPEATRAVSTRRADAKKATNVRYGRESISIPGATAGCQGASMMVLLKMFRCDNRMR